MLIQASGNHEHGEPQQYRWTKRSKDTLTHKDPKIHSPCVHRTTCGFLAPSVGRRFPRRRNMREQEHVSSWRTYWDLMRPVPLSKSPSSPEPASQYLCLFLDPSALLVKLLQDWSCQGPGGVELSLSLYICLPGGSEYHLCLRAGSAGVEVTPAGSRMVRPGFQALTWFWRRQNFRFSTCSVCCQPVG